nr:hypothetical protein [Tanacetum cinerariifolium]
MALLAYLGRKFISASNVVDKGSNVHPVIVVDYVFMLLALFQSDYFVFCELCGGYLWRSCCIMCLYCWYQTSHNVVRDTLVDIHFRSGISAEKEVDIGSSPLTHTEMVDFVPGRAVIDVAHRKRVKYEAKCANIGYEFLPFSFSSFEELEMDAVTLIKRIRRFSVAEDIGAHVAIF